MAWPWDREAGWAEPQNQKQCLRWARELGGESSGEVHWTLILAQHVASSILALLRGHSQQGRSSQWSPPEGAALLEQLQDGGDHFSPGLLWTD